MRLSLHRLSLATCYLVGLGLWGFFLWRGWPYYRLALIDRPRHELYWSLKPGGELGVMFGIIGATMMVVMLAYSLRKRIAFLRRIGPLSLWLDYHILLGVLGPLFILLHSSFKVGGLVALSFWSMVAVASSGIFGRFLYRQIPRTQGGDELTLVEVQRLDGELGQRLRRDFGLSSELLERLDAAAEAGTGGDRSLLSIVLGWGIDNLKLFLNLRSLRPELGGISPDLRREVEVTFRRKALLRRRLGLWQRLRELFHYWHVFHKPFAIIMYLFMVVHIGVAYATGYSWS